MRRKEEAQEPLYSERLSSNRTEALFIGMTLFFSGLLVYSLLNEQPIWLAAIFLALAFFFLFYSLNYRTLSIKITQEYLALRFGLFSWQIPVDNIAASQIDDVHGLMRYGGAGIHFMLIQGSYRASFNFLDGPRIVISFKNKVGPVKDISFSTGRPEEVLRCIHDVIADDLGSRELV